MTTIRYPYLGPLGALQRLPLPTQTLEAPATRGDSVHANMTGGVSVLRLATARRSWTLPYDYAGPVVSDLLTSFHEGLFGDGPFVFVDPTVRNVLSLDQATCGRRDLAAAGWVATAGTVAKSATAAPELAAASGVLAWTSGTAAASLRPGPASVDVSTAPAWLPDESCTGSVWATASASTAAAVHLTGYDADGTPVGTVSHSVTLGTSWGRVAVTTDPDQPELSGAVVVLPRLVLGAGVASVQIAGAQVEYAGQSSDWQRGHGAPRVLLTATPGRSVPQIGYATHSLLLREV